MYHTVTFNSYKIKIPATKPKPFTLLANKRDSKFADTSSRSVRKKAVCRIKINEDVNTKYSKPVFVEGL
jgi:hypothetical protein